MSTCVIFVDVYVVGSVFIVYFMLVTRVHVGCITVFVVVAHGYVVVCVVAMIVVTPVAVIVCVSLLYVVLYLP